MKKIIRSGNDLLLGILMLAVGIFLLVSDQVITGRAMSTLGGIWAEAKTYIMLLAGILIFLACVEIIMSFNLFKSQNTSGIQIPMSMEVFISGVSLLLYAFLMPIITFFPATMALIFVLAVTFARKENSGMREDGKKNISKKQVLFLAVYSAVLTLVLYFVFSKILGCVLP